ncbi:lipoprotein [Acinetobacter sp. 187]|uniref:Type IV secretion system putative lipoprotein virB7 n=1 Tax=Acinetobacter lanii TaxID=2715163 RepID=A0A6G8S1F8_9GAMM|nr:lipoprotein [Acinetobacter lanii]QIO07955.1 lipoprotein [Acinetobacter lanii]
MNKVLIVLFSLVLLSACSTMNVRPTATVMVGSGL